VLRCWSKEFIRSGDEIMPGKGNATLTAAFHDG